MARQQPTLASPSPVGAGSLDDLAAALAALREWAGSPSYAAIVRRIGELRRTRGVPASEQQPGRVTVYDCFRPGRTRLDIDLVADVVAALGAAERVGEWRQAYAVIEGRGAAGAVVRVDAPTPPPAESFVGRVDALAALCEHPGPWCVTGMPGLGKTELALAAAQRLGGDSGWDHRLLIHLRGYDEELPPADPDGALGALLRHLGVTPAAIHPLDRAGRIARTRERIAGRRVLVVLDNAADDPQVEPLLEALEGARVIVTSRHRLGSGGLRQLELELLSEEESLRLLSLTAPGAPVGDDADSRRVVELCGRLPLHLTVTGARISESPGWTMADQVHRLESLPREDAVVPALASSYRALAPGDAAVFRALGLHAGDAVTPAAAAALAGLDLAEASAALDRLAAEHLVRLDDRGRARLHDLLRAYATRLGREYDARSGRSAAVLRLSAHHLDAVASAVADIGWTGPTHEADADAAHDWLTAETDNIVTCALAAVADGASDGAYDALVSIAVTLMPWLEADARIAEAGALGRAAWASPQRAHRAAAARLLARVHDLSGEFEEALGWARRAVDLGPEPADPAATNQLGNVLTRLGRLEEAAAAYTRTVELVEALGDQRGLGRYLSNLATTHQARGDLDAALETFTTAMRISEGVGDLANVSTVCTNLADLFLLREDLTEAADAARRALEIDQRLGDRLHLARHLSRLGEVAALQGRHDEALHQLDLALAAARDVRSWVYEAESLLIRGSALAGSSRLDAAVESLTEGLAIGTRIGSPWIEADAHNRLGRTRLALGELDAAAEHFRAARAIAQGMGEPTEAARAEEGLADIARRSGTAGQGRGSTR